MVGDGGEETADAADAAAGDVTDADELRRRVQDSVEARVPVDDRERASIARCRRELARLERPFDERADPVHVTGSALVVGPRGIVLLHHRRLRIWVQPGGHVDAGETPWDAARRETAEETGLTVPFATDPPRLAHVDVHAGSRGHTHLDLRYLLAGGVADPVPPPGESQHVRWFAWDEAMAVADPGLVGILRRLAAQGPLREHG